MPQILCRGMEVAQVQHLSKVLAPQFSNLMSSPEDWFVFEHIAKTSFVSGEKATDSAMVDVLWFDRGQVIQNVAALMTYQAITALGYDQVEVVFHPLVKENYYENGTHY